MDVRNTMTIASGEPSEGQPRLGGMLRSFALLPPERLAQTFAAQRARFDPRHAATTIPHVTMKLAFRLGKRPLATHADLIVWLRGQCRHQQSFPVYLDEVGVFSSCGGHGHVVYIAVRRTSELVELHDRLVFELARAGVQTPGMTIAREIDLFFPHLTLAQGLSAATAQEIFEIARCEHVPSAFMADRLVLGRSDDGVVWSLAGEIGFAGVCLGSESLSEIEWR